MSLFNEYINDFCTASRLKKEISSLVLRAYDQLTYARHKLQDTLKGIYHLVQQAEDLSLKSYASIRMGRITNQVANLELTIFQTSPFYQEVVGEVSVLYSEHLPPAGR